jgi:hypothetical protein
MAFLDALLAVIAAGAVFGYGIKLGYALRVWQERGERP